MLALDAHPHAAALASSITGATSAGLRVVEAEGGLLAGGATVVTPPSTWTGAANWSGGSYVAVPAGGSVHLPVTDDLARVHPIINRRPGDLGTSSYVAVDARGRRTMLGTLANGGLRETGTVEADGLLRPFPLQRALPPGTVAILVESDGDLQLDALLLQPAVSTTVYVRGSERPAVLYANGGARTTTIAALAAGTGRTYAADGAARGSSRSPVVVVTGGGFAVTT
jgi:hypothetical protein